MKSFAKLSVCIFKEVLYIFRGTATIKQLIFHFQIITVYTPSLAGGWMLHFHLQTGQPLGRKKVCVNRC